MATSEPLPTDGLSPRLLNAIGSYGATPPDPPRCSRCGKETARPIRCQVLLLRKVADEKNGKSIASRTRTLCDDCAADVLRAAAECMDDEHFWEVIENLRSAAEPRRIPSFDAQKPRGDFT